MSFFRLQTLRLSGAGESGGVGEKSESSGVVCSSWVVFDGDGGETHSDWHSSFVAKLFSLPPQPVYTKCWHSMAVSL